MKYRSRRRYNYATWSLPSRECGLKLGVENDKDVKVMVTPFAGVWIEILIQTDEDHLSMSLPSRECGLKSKEYDTLQYSNSVTPFAGVWIEIMC